MEIVYGCSWPIWWKVNVKRADVEKRQWKLEFVNGSDFRWPKGYWINNFAEILSSVKTLFWDETVTYCSRDLPSLKMKWHFWQENRKYTFFNFSYRIFRKKIPMYTKRSRTMKHKIIDASLAYESILHFLLPVYL